MCMLTSSDICICMVFLEHMYGIMNCVSFAVSTLMSVPNSPTASPPGSGSRGACVGSHPFLPHVLHVISTWQSQTWKRKAFHLTLSAFYAYLLANGCATACARINVRGLCPPCSLSPFHAALYEYLLTNGPAAVRVCRLCFPLLFLSNAWTDTTFPLLFLSNAWTDTTFPPPLPLQRVD